MRYARAILYIFIMMCANPASVEAEESCREVIGELQSIEVPPGKSVRVMFFVRGPQPGYIEICKIADGKKQLLYAAVATGNAWYRAIHIPPYGKAFKLENYSAWISAQIPHPWTGMRRVVTSYGYTFNWFEKADDTTPNVIVETCLQSNSAECPSHFSPKSADNLARMSEYGRKRWLVRWAHIHVPSR